MTNDEGIELLDCMTKHLSSGGLKTTRLWSGSHEDTAVQTVPITVSHIWTAFTI